VDDPIITCTADVAGRKAIDLILQWWLILGIPLAWTKGLVGPGAADHQWIGVVYSMSGTNAVMRLPTAFLNDLRDLLRQFCSPEVKHMPLSAAETLAGRAARVAHILPDTRPFVGSLYAALTSAKERIRGGQREAPPGQVPTSRFKTVAKFFVTLLAEQPGLLPLERKVSAKPPSAIPSAPDEILFDASPWGGGAVLRSRASGAIIDAMYVQWTSSSTKSLNLEVGTPKNQTFWEYLMLWISLEAWAEKYPQHRITLLGDNVSCLILSLKKTGKGPRLAISRELALRKARRGWRWDVAHIPSEFNILADTLSRSFAPERANVPRSLQGRLMLQIVPATLWCLL